MLAPGGLRAFQFNEAFPPTITQSELYDSSVRSATMDFINGFNATMIVFGQTGSGKTFTMFGPDGNPAPAHQGIVPRALREVWAVLDDRHDVIEGSLALSCVEVFGAEINDLLQAAPS